MYSREGILDYAGLRLWGGIALIFLSLVGGAIVVDKLYIIFTKDILPHIFGTKTQFNEIVNRTV